MPQLSLPVPGHPLGQVDLAVADGARGVILVENLESFRVLTALAEDRCM